MPNFNEIEKSEIPRIIQNQSFDELLRNTSSNISYKKDQGLVIVGKLTYIAQKIIQEASLMTTHSSQQQEISDVNRTLKTRFQSQLSFLQSLIFIIQINSRDLNKLSEKPIQTKFFTLAPNIQSLPPLTHTYQTPKTSQDFDQSNQHHEYQISPHLSFLQYH